MALWSAGAVQHWALFSVLSRVQHWFCRTKLPTLVYTTFFRAVPDSRRPSPGRDFADSVHGAFGPVRNFSAPVPNLSGATPTLPPRSRSLSLRLRLLRVLLGLPFTSAAGMRRAGSVDTALGGVPALSLGGQGSSSRYAPDTLCVQNSSWDAHDRCLFTLFTPKSWSARTTATSLFGDRMRLSGTLPSRSALAVRGTGGVSPLRSSSTAT